MSHNHPPVGAYAVGPERRRRPWWLWLLLALAALVLFFVLISRCGSNTTNPGSGIPTSAATSSTSPSASASASSSSSSPTSSTSYPRSPSSTSTAVGGVGATLTAAGKPLLPLSLSAPSGDLSTYAGQSVRAAGVTVQSVPADEGFWVGDSETDRVWVQLVGEGESPYEVKAGDQVQFTGELVPNPGSFADTAGLVAGEGAAQLTRQKNHIEVKKSVLSRR